MWNVAFDKDTMELGKAFFAASGLNATACVRPLGKGCSLAALFGAGKEVAGFLANAGEDIVILANADNFPLIRMLGGLNSTVISCGLSGRDSITASSIESGTGISFLLCIQRALKALDGTLLEPQEIGIKMAESDIDINKAILVATAALMCGAAPDRLGDVAI